MAVVCCMGVTVLFMKKFVFDDPDEDDELKDRKRKIAPMLGVEDDEKNPEYEIIVVNSDPHRGNL
jgi:hypothetical protein